MRSREVTMRVLDGNGRAQGTAAQAVFPFLIGCERSGTTMLRAMFDARGDLAVPDESHFVAPLAARRAKLDTPVGVDLDRLVNLLTASPGFRRWGLDVNDVRYRLSAQASGGLAEAVRTLYGMYADHLGKPRYADKTTTYVFEVTPISELLPEARFVHLVRDGRNVALSLLDVDWGPSTVEQAAMWWRVRVAAAREAGQQLTPDRYTEIRFEELAADPEPVLRRLAGFLDLTWDADMLRYFQAARHILDAMPTKRRTTHRNLRHPPNPRLRDWQRELPANAQLTFEALTGDLLEELGYERRFPSVKTLTIRDERRALLQPTPKLRRPA